MSTLLAAAATTEGGGAPVGELLAIAAFTTAATLATLWAVTAHRRGGARPLRFVAKLLERALGVPGWAALPGAGGIALALVTLTSSSWDIGLHIDLGRDEGPLGTSAHYPLLLGMFGTFLLGILAVGMAPRDPRRASAAAWTVPGLGPVPAAGLLQFAGASFGMLAFPLDDLWHRVFGQDVTLWGPTHLMIIGGTLVAGVGSVLLLVEGARAAGREPFGGRGTVRRPLAMVLGSVFLYLWASALHEFNWGVPQFRQVWHPLLLTFGGAQSLVMVRLLAGRGGALGAVGLYLPLSLALAFVIGGPLEVTQPAVPLFLVAAVLVELVGTKGLVRRPVAFGALAGLAIGTVGFGAEYAWSQVDVPLPWGPDLLAEALPTAIAAGVAGGVLSALMAQALTGTLAPGRRSLVLALAASAATLGLATNAAIVTVPEGVTASLTLSDPRQEVPSGGREAVQVADLTVRLNRPGLAEDANWFFALGWQGGGRYLNRLEAVGDGTYRTTRPVPIGGRWKTLVRLHAGRTMVATPIRLGPDPAIGFAGVPARPQATRGLVHDHEIMQLERKVDAPMGFWVPATLLVLSLIVGILVFLAVVCVRLGRTVRRPAPGDRTREGLLLKQADRVLGAVEQRVAVGAGRS